MKIISRLMMLFKAKANSALDRVEDPREIMDYAYAEQKQLLVKTKRGLVDVATSKAQLSRQAQSLRARVPKLEDQARRALDANREDLARIALERRQTIRSELEQLDVQVADVAEDERRLSQTEQQLAVRIDEFRSRRDIVAARYTAAKAQVRVKEAFTGISGEFADLSLALGRAVEKTERMQDRANAIGELIESGSLALPIGGHDTVEAELSRVQVVSTVDAELKALKAGERLDPGPPALDSAS